MEELPLLRVQQPMALLPLLGLPATHHNKAKASGMMTSCPHSSVVAEIMGQTSESETISKVKPVSHLRHDTAAYLPEVLAKEVEDNAIVPVPLLQDYIHQRKPAQLLCVQRHWWQSAATTAQLLGDEGAHLVDGDGVICPRHVALGGDVVDLVLKELNL